MMPRASVVRPYDFLRGLAQALDRLEVSSLGGTPKPSGLPLAPFAGIYLA